jgi:Tetrapyrrole (Corrin/Porphyrin) Methylases
MVTGRLHHLGIGPGDLELLTLKALRLLQSTPVVAYPVSDGGKSLARSIVADYLKHAPIEVPMYFPFKPEQSAQPYYNTAAETLAEHLSCGQDVAGCVRGIRSSTGRSCIYSRAWLTALSPKLSGCVIADGECICARDAADVSQ